MLDVNIPLPMTLDVKPGETRALIHQKVCTSMYII